MKSQITLYDYINYWYRTYKMPKHQETTIDVQLNYINTHIRPSDLGKMLLVNIRTKDIQEFLSGLLLHGNKSKLTHKTGSRLSNWTVQKIRVLIIAALNQAMKENIIDYNYAADTDTIPTPVNTGMAFSMEQQQIFLESTKNHRFYPAYLLLFSTGCRRGEILGLSWENVLFKENVIFINQTLVSYQNGYLLKRRTKTTASIRSIPITAELKCILRDWQRKQKYEKIITPGWNNTHNLVFTDKNGSPVNPAYFSRNFKNKCRRLGFSGNLHLHSTRHTFATNMLQLNVPLPDIQALGGWSTTNTLMKIYAHTVQKSHRKAIQKLYKSFNYVK
ncbi:MAG: site-specific integrase [Bacteroidales bacterium]|nr:site-specific integrase [Bacteroidales bacterium]